MEGLCIKIRYVDMNSNTEKGFNTWQPSRKAFMQRLEEMKIRVDGITKLMIRKPGEDHYQEYDPTKLQ